VGIGLSSPEKERGEREVRRVARWPVAVLWLVLAVGFGILVLWVAGFEPLQWWRAHQQAAIAKAVPPRHAPTGPISIVQPTPLGTDSSISKVPLPLHLTATRVGRNSREGYADIGVNVLSPQTYKAGAILANGARLEEIYSDSVVLERDHYRARLYIEGRASPAGAGPTMSALLTVGGTMPNPAAVADSRDTLTEFVRIAPVFEGDHFRALELYPSAHSDVFGRLGLKPGDRVTAIDGVALKNSKEAIGELRRLSEGASVNVTIERGGKPQMLSLDGFLFRAGGSRG